MTNESMSIRIVIEFLFSFFTFLKSSIFFFQLVHSMSLECKKNNQIPLTCQLRSFRKSLIRNVWSCLWQGLYNVSEPFQWKIKCPKLKMKFSWVFKTIYFWYWIIQSNEWNWAIAIQFTPVPSFFIIISQLTFEFV